MSNNPITNRRTDQIVQSEPDVALAYREEQGVSLYLVVCQCTMHPMVTSSVVPDVFEYMAPWPSTTLLSTIDHMSKALYLEFSWRSRPRNSVSAPRSRVAV